jgi:hypothetical protein
VSFLHLPLLSGCVPPDRGGCQETAWRCGISRSSKRTGRQPQPGSRSDVIEILTATVAELPEELRRTLTWDQGNKMTKHAVFTGSTGIRSTSASPVHRGNEVPTRTPRPPAPVVPEGHRPARPRHRGPSEGRSRAECPPSRRPRMEDSNRGSDQPRCDDCLRPPAETIQFFDRGRQGVIDFGRPLVDLAGVAKALRAVEWIGPDLIPMQDPAASSRDHLHDGGRVPFEDGDRGRSPRIAPRARGYLSREHLMRGLPSPSCSTGVVGLLGHCEPLGDDGPGRLPASPDASRGRGTT